MARQRRDAIVVDDEDDGEEETVREYLNGKENLDVLEQRIMGMHVLFWSLVTFSLILWSLAVYATISERHAELVDAWRHGKGATNGAPNGDDSVRHTQREEIVGLQYIEVEYPPFGFSLFTKDLLWNSAIYILTLAQSITIHNFLAHKRQSR